MLLNAVLVLAAVGPAVAWWDVGHQTVGAIGRLSMKNAKSQENLDNILSYLDHIYTDEYGVWPYGDFKVNATQRPQMKSNLLAYAGVWPDITKGFYNVKIFDNWHYINQKYDPDNLDTENTGCNTETDTNIVTVMEQLVKQVPDMYNGRPTARWYQHFAIGYITHLVGDSHQPFHTMGRCIMYEGELDQDLGGNRWTLYMPDGTSSNAHAMWDSVGFEWGNEKQEEIEKIDNTYDTFAKEIMAKIPPEAVVTAGYDLNIAKDGDPEQFPDRFQVWLKESNAHAIETYEKTTMNGTVDQALLDWVVDISEVRIAAAGYRLGALLDGMLAKLDVPPFTEGAKTAETEAVAAPAPVETPAPAPVEEESGSSPWGYIGVALGGIVVGGAIGFFGGKSKGRRQALESSSSLA